MEEFGKATEYELSRTEFVKEGSTWYLRVYVDKKEGEDYGLMSTDDCEIVSRYLSDRLDKEDPIPQNYYLEVSSPGMDRPLVCDKDYVRFAGRQIEIKLYEPMEGSKLLLGELVGKEQDIVSIIDPKGRKIELPLDKIAKINLAVIF